ncbi:MAG: glycosyltransferase family 87 protein, partial [bacterium]
MIMPNEGAEMHSERSAPGGGHSPAFDWKDWRKGENLFFASIILLSLFRLLHQVLKFLKESPFIDAAGNYLYWTMARSGLDLFDPKAIEAARAAFPHRAAGGMAVNVPSFYVLFQPLSLVPYSVFPALWMAGSLGFMFLGTLIFLREERDRLSWPSFTFIVLIAAMYQPLYEDLGLGQMNTP